MYFSTFSTISQPKVGPLQVRSQNFSIRNITPRNSMGSKHWALATNDICILRYRFVLSQIRLLYFDFLARKICCKTKRKMQSHFFLHTYRQGSVMRSDSWSVRRLACPVTGARADLLNGVSHIISHVTSFGRRSVIKVT